MFVMYLFYSKLYTVQYLSGLLKPKYTHHWQADVLLQDLGVGNPDDDRRATRSDPDLATDSVPLRMTSTREAGPATVAAEGWGGGGMPPGMFSFVLIGLGLLLLLYLGSGVWGLVRSVQRLTEAVVGLKQGEGRGVPVGAGRADAAGLVLKHLQAAMVAAGQQAEL